MVLGGLIFFAGLAKLFDLQGFFIGLLELDLFDANVAWVISLVTPFLELLVGFWLLIGWRADWASVAGFVMLVGFTSVLFSAWWRGLEIDCACFGPLSFGSTYFSWFLRNALFLLAFLWLFWRVRDRMSRASNH